MTKKLFWQDPYLATLDTRVATVDGDRITLAETIFFAFSGGQESDSGVIGGYPVLEARKAGFDLVYTLPTPHTLQPGSPARIEIDWTRRYRLMRLHFAAEIVLELVYQMLNPIEKIGAHIAQDKARIDFVWGENIAKVFPQIVQQAHTLIEANHPIISAFSDEAKQKRFWKIAGFAQVPCGGTHLRTTGEIGLIHLKRKNIGKGKERIEIYVD